MKLRHMLIALFLFFQVYDASITYLFWGWESEANILPRLLWKYAGFEVLVLAKVFVALVVLWVTRDKEGASQQERIYQLITICFCTCATFAACVNNTYILLQGG